MPISMSLNLPNQHGQAVDVYRRTLGNILTSKSLEEALDNRKWYEKVSDYCIKNGYFDGVAQADIIESLYNVVEADTSTNFQKSIVELASKATDPAKMAAQLSLETKQEGHYHRVEVNLDGYHIATSKYFEKAIHFSPIFFEPENEHSSKYKLHTNFHELERMNVFLSMTESTGSLRQLLQSESLFEDHATEKTKKVGEEIILDASITKQFCQNDMNRTYLGLESKSHVEQYRLGLIRDFEPGLKGQLSQGASVLYEEFCRLSVEDQLSLFDIKFLNSEHPISQARSNLEEKDREKLDALIEFRLKQKYPESIIDNFIAVFNAASFDTRVPYLVYGNQSIGNNFCIGSNILSPDSQPDLTGNFGFDQLNKKTVVHQNDKQFHMVSTTPVNYTDAHQGNDPFVPFNEVVEIDVTVRARTEDESFFLDAEKKVEELLTELNTISPIGSPSKQPLPRELVLRKVDLEKQLGLARAQADRNAVVVKINSASLKLVPTGLDSNKGVSEQVEQQKKRVQERQEADFAKLRFESLVSIYA